MLLFSACLQEGISFKVKIKNALNASIPGFVIGNTNPDYNFSQRQSYCSLESPIASSEEDKTEENSSASKACISVSISLAEK